MAFRALHRRHFLRGTGAFGASCVGLPLLEAMTNTHGTALANGGALPVRVGVWFWGNGLRPEHFFPDGAHDKISAKGEPGTLKPWDLSRRQHTKPLADAGLSPYLSLVSGTSVGAIPEQAHHDAKNAVLTGSYDWFEGDEERGYAGPITPSFDQIAARSFRGQTPFDSLVLGVQEGAANNEPGNAGHFTSSTGRNKYIRPEYSPLALFQRLFAGQVGPQTDGSVAERMLRARRSILDAVVGDIRQLDAALGQRDKACLDRHFTAIRALERRLGGSTCERPLTPPLDWPTVAGKQRLRDRSRAMSEMLALALACDMTRAFSFQFTVFQTGHNFAHEPDLSGLVSNVDPSNKLTMDTSFHEAAHEAKFQNQVRLVTNFTFENLAYTLRLLAETPEGDSNLLHNSAILATSEHTEPMSHSTEDLPLIFAGLGGGRLKGGLWYHGRGEKVARAGLTLLRAAGLPVKKFGTASKNPDGNEDNDPSTGYTFSALEV